jgi:ribonuclease Z
VSIVLGLLALAGCSQVEDFLVSRGADQLTKGDRDELLSDGALHVVLCGTGSPIADADRAAGCVAVMAAGQLYLVDVGPGSWENVQLWRLPRAKLAGVLLTHFHSDHIGDLGETATQSWIAGRKGALPVYGPPGVEKVVAGFAQAYELDAGYRHEHHGDALELAGSELAAKTVELPAPEGSAVVVERDGVRVTAFAVDHRPVTPAYGYRFEYRGRSVVISGDTAKSENVTKHSQGADVLVHEVLAHRIVERLSAELGERGNKRMAQLTADILEYHADPAEAVATATAAGVHVLVMTHLVPAVPGPFLNYAYLGDVDVPDALTVVLGEDGTQVTLPGDSEAIDIGEIDS